MKLSAAILPTTSLVICLLSLNVIGVVGSGVSPDGDELIQSLYEGDIISVIYYATLSESFFSVPLSANSFIRVKTLLFPSLAVAAVFVFRFALVPFSLRTAAFACQLAALLPVLVGCSLLSFTSQPSSVVGSLWAFTLYGVFYMSIACLVILAIGGLRDYIAARRQAKPVIVDKPADNHRMERRTGGSFSRLLAGLSPVLADA